MKKLILSALVLLFAFSQDAFARRYDDDTYIAYLKNEIYIDYGAPSVLELTSKYRQSVGDDKYTGYRSKYTGTGGIGYNRYINPYLHVGGYFGISREEIQVKNEKVEGYLYTSQVKSLVGMLSVGWTYYREGIWDISCEASLGVVHKDDFQTKVADALEGRTLKLPKENDKTTVAYNITPIKVRVGGGIVGGFAELGFGYKGLFNAGLSIKF